MKLTKNELKARRDALKRYTRYLPTLQLKKQQLQAEVRQVEARMQAVEARLHAAATARKAWAALFTRTFEPSAFLEIQTVNIETGNIAGVPIPVLNGVTFAVRPPGPGTPLWYDDALIELREAVRLTLEARVLDEQRRRLEQELLITSQRVNLFEKVKIPEAREAIRRIRIYLGDQQTAAVARAKQARARALKRSI